MSIKPLDIMMSITHSQNNKPLDSDHNIKHAQQAEMIGNQNQKNKESVSKIPDDENNTEQMDTIKQGMTDNSAFYHDDSSKKQNQDEYIPDKALLDDDNGHSIDLLG